MRLHVDTSFLIDWQRQDPLAVPYVQEIVDGRHEVSFDAIAYTECTAASSMTPRKRIVIDALLALGRFIPVNLQASELAAEWLAVMDAPQRRAHFSDALIAASAAIDGSTLLTSDRVAARVFPVPALFYR